MMPEDYDPREYAAELFHWMEQQEALQAIADDAEFIELCDSAPFNPDDE